MSESKGTKNEMKMKTQRYLLKVPENNIGSCGMIEIRDRKSFKQIVDVSIPSIKISPSTQAIRKIAPINELLPLKINKTKKKLTFVCEKR